MLTAAQLQTLKAAITAETDATFVSYREQGATGLMANWLNEAAAPAFYIWRSSIPPTEYREKIVWTEVDGLTVGKARIWEWVTENMTADLDASKANVRAGLAEVWPANQTTRGQLLAIANRAASRIEKLFASGTGSTASPATMAVEGPIRYEEFIGL